MSQAIESPQAPGLQTRVRPSRASRRAAAMDAQKRSFLRMVSHELRTPLNSILGFSEILAQELYGPLGPPQYKEYAEIILASGQRLLKLVNQVLEIARLEGHAVDLALEPESLDHAMDDVLDGLAEELRSRPVRVCAPGLGSLPPVLADSRGLRTILANLIQNALAHSPAGGQVRVRAERIDGDVEILIADDGPGVDPAEIARLLRPFEQGDNTLTRSSAGAGLGLPIVDLLCQAMGGRLELRSALGEGLTACVRLPAA